jgi:hypothetical protein
MRRKCNMNIGLKFKQEILKKTGKTTVCNEVPISSRFGRKLKEMIQERHDKEVELE